uniref:Uncharacterized protein n=1 Tax=Anguilla anguilla TaxID=7936 RepID=A0A0E9X1T7_ANGAN
MHVTGPLCPFQVHHNAIFVLRKLELSLRLSLWVLYSIMVLGGKLRTRRSVSLIREVVTWSLAVLFQIDRISSWKRIDTTTPQISSPTINCSPSMARMMFSQNREASPFRRRMIHFPPFLFASSSHMGLMPSLKMWKSLWPIRSPGRTR